MLGQAGRLVPKAAQVPFQVDVTVHSYSSPRVKFVFHFSSLQSVGFVLNGLILVIRLGNIDSYHE